MSDNIKEQIIEDLYNDRSLSSEQIIFIAKNLKDDSQVPVPYDHDNIDSALACGVTKNDADKFNEKFRLVIRTMGKSAKFSQLVERLENIVYTDAKFMRMVIIQCMRYAEEHQSNPLESLLKKLMGDINPKKDDGESDDKKNTD